MKLKDAVQSIDVNAFTIPCMNCGEEMERSKNFKVGRCFKCKKLQRKARQLKSNKV